METLSSANSSLERKAWGSAPEVPGDFHDDEHAHWGPMTSVWRNKDGVAATPSAIKDV